ncbi:MAG: type II toxin-antitoxin system RelE/ParE family toxin [Spirochaetaceae bacterium]|jgi:mRNA interferase RelE/StbE|nr:type II toxin-antitoxin system RelE/ParE family toxin [Spirochaetaceae bacterium]
MYKISIKKSALKELKKVPKKEQILISQAIKKLAKEPHPHGHKKLVGADITYRIRIRDYRVIYNVYDQELTLDVIRVNHRKDVYR